MKKILLSLLFACILSYFNYAQNIGINGTGANAHASALLDVDASPSNNKGFLAPRIPLTAINAAAPVSSPATSLLVYNTATASTGTNAVSPGYYYWDGVKWVRFAFNSSGSTTEAWTITGNAGTTPTTNFLGTTDNQSLVFKTNNTEKLRILNTGNVGIGNINPWQKLEVAGNLFLNEGVDNSFIYHDGHNLTFSGYPGGYAHGVYTFRPAWGSSGTTFSVLKLQEADNSGLHTDKVQLHSSSSSFLMGGNLGIGTTTPAEMLTIENGNLQLGEALGGTGLGRKLYFSNTSNQSDDIYLQRENVSSDNSNLQLMLGDNSSGDDKFLIKTTASTTPLLTVVNNGNVGVNTASAPTEKLEVQGSVKIVDGTQGLNKVLTSDATGKATWKQPSGGYRQKYTLQGAQTYPNNISTLMNFPTVTIPYTGFYLINFKSFFQVPTTDEHSYYLDVYINGTLYSHDETYAYCIAGNYLNLTDVYTLQANAGDVITLHLIPVVGNQTITATAATYTRVRFDLLFLGN